MGLRAPGILTFIISIVLTVMVVLMKFFSAEIPLLSGHEFWVLLVAQLILIIGCMVRA
ncbi:MAG: hypothetical protein ACRBCJ_03280 [Hyphomicrobiaceae bacterium]